MSAWVYSAQDSLREKAACGAGFKAIRHGLNNLDGGRKAEGALHVDA
jgi:hypothetical protein